MRQMKFQCQLKLAYLEYGIIVLVILDMLNSVFDKDDFNMNNILERLSVLDEGCMFGLSIVS